MSNANPTASDLLLGRYRVEGSLGQGGFGVVVKAYDTQLQRTVAIKSLLPGLSTTNPSQYQELQERFKREAQAGSRMGINPYIVAVYDQVAAPNGALYLILEYMANGTLMNLLKGAGLPVGKALSLSEDIALGLEAAHKHGIVHRDIKPANIFLTLDGHAKVGDFGIAQIDDLSGRTSATMGHPGTPLYMSPEQERSSAYVRPSSDQYSLGLVLFEMLTGQVYKRLEPRQAEVLLAQQPAGAAALIRRMIANDSSDRFENMEKVVDAVRQITREPQIVPSWITLALATDDRPTRPMPPPVHASSPPPVPQSQQGFSRRSVIVGGTALLIAGGVAGIAANAFGSKGNIVTATSQAAIAAATVPLSPVGVAAMSANTMISPATVTPTQSTVVAVAATSPAIPSASVAPTAVPTATSFPTSATAPTPTAVPATATPTIVPTATPVPPTPTPMPKPGDVLYQADWSKGADGWGGKGWTAVGGMMASDGSSNGASSYLVAPFQPPTIDYALEAEIQALGTGRAAYGIGLLARVDESGGIRAGIGSNDERQGEIGLMILASNDFGGVGLEGYPIAFQPYQADKAWHTYWLAVKGNTIAFSLDGKQVLQATDNTRLKNGKIGINGRSPCNLRSFKVVAL